MLTCATWLLFAVCFIIVASADVYIVLMHGKPVVYNKKTSSVPGTKLNSASHHVEAYASYLTEQHDKLLQNTFHDASFKKLYSYNHLLHGFAAELTDEQASKLRLADGVKLVSRERVFKSLTTYTPTLLGLETVAWPQLGGFEDAGEGIVIGLVDTGIDPHHPSFANSSQQRYSRINNFWGTCDGGANFPSDACNGKIVAARYFSETAKRRGNVTETITTVLDTEGHGCHTTSTAAGNHGVPLVINGINYGNASGVAPRARIAMYKAFFADKGYTSDIIAAVEQAVRDGVDVLNLSLGGADIPEGYSVFTDPFEQALLAAVHSGVYVVQAAGNAGPDQSSVTSFSPWVMSVAASNTGRGYKASLELGNGNRVRGLGLSRANIDKHPLLMASEAYTGTNYSTSSCTHASQFNQTLVRGKIFVCKYSELDSIAIPRVLEVAKAAKDLDAVGFAMLIDPSSNYSDYMTVLYPIPLPGIVINNVNASLELLTYYNSTKDAVARINENTVEFNRTVPVVMDFSSRGPNVFNVKKDPVDVLKPNILAPGNAVWGAWTKASTTQPGEFALKSGTSMAAPQIAGAAALIKQKHPDWTPAAITSSMMTTASIVDSHGQLINSLTETDLVPGTPFDFGAGFVNVTAALDPGIVFDAGYQDYVLFLCSLDQTASWKALVKASTDSSCVVEREGPYNLNSPSITVSQLTGNVTVHRTVTSVTDVVETYSVLVTRPEKVGVTVMPSSFTLGPYESASFIVLLGLEEQAPLNDYVFGYLTLQGDKGHSARVFITVASVPSSK